MAVRTNRHPNPFARSALAGWSTTVRAVTTAAATYGGTPGVECTVSGTGTTHVTVWTQPTSSMIVTPGETLPISVQVRVSRAGQVQAQVEWRTGAGVLSYTPTAWVSCAAGTVTTLALSPVVPAGIATGRLVVTANGASLTTGDLVWVGGVLVGASGTAFDGDTVSAGARYAWVGTAYASASTETVTTVTLTPHDAPPRVDIECSDLPAGTTSLSITRIVDGWERDVRLAGSILAGTTAYTEDAEAPTGVTVYYHVTALGSTGAVLDEWQGSTGPIADAPGALVWISDPLDATSARLVQCTSETDPERPFEREVSDSWGIGAEFAHTSHGALRHGVRRIEILCRSQEEHASVRDIVSGPIQIRAAAWRDLPTLLYGTPRGVSLRVTPSPDDWWSLATFTIVPSVGPMVPTLLPRRTLGDVEDEGTALGELEDQYLTLGAMEVGH